VSQLWKIGETLIYMENRTLLLYGVAKEFLAQDYGVVPQRKT